MSAPTTGSLRKRRLHGTELTDSEWSKIDEILAARGWSSLNRETTWIELIEDEQGIVGFIVLQLHPFVGPEYVRPSARGTGLAAQMADDVIEWMREMQARGWIVVAESEHAARLCRERGMTRIMEPVFRTQ